MRFPRYLATAGKIGVATALVASLLLVAAPPRPASASTRFQPPAPVTFDGFASARDAAVWGSYLYVSLDAGLSDSSGDAVAQIGFDGTVHNVLGPIPGAFGVVIRQGILYVAATETDSIKRYDLSTDPPTKLGSTSLSPLTGPRRLVVTNGRIWFDTNCTLSWDARIGSMLPDGTDVQQELPPVGTGGTDWTYCAQLQGSPNSKRLFIASEGLSPPHLSVYDISSAPYIALSDDDAGQWTHGDYPAGALYPMSGGTTFAMSGLWADRGLDIRKISDFTVVDHYDASWGRATSLDHTAANGGMFAVGFEPDDGSLLGGVAVLQDVATTPAVEYNVPDLMHNGVLFTPDGSTILALATDSSTTKLYTIDPLDVPSTLSLSATPAHLAVGDTVDLDGSLAFSDASSSAGRTVTLTRTDANGTATVGDATTDSAGAYHLTDHPPAGDVTYTATFDAVDHYLTATAQDSVIVDKLPSSVSVKVSRGTVTFGQTVRITGHLGGGTDSRVLGLYAKPYGGDPILLKKATVDNNGDLTASYTPKKNTTFIARFEGDDAHNASNDQATTKVRVILNAKMIDFASVSGKYKVYRSGTYPKCLVHVTPNHAGSSVQFVLQAYVKGAWRSVDRGSFRLNADSLVAVKVGITPGYNARIRAKLPSHADHLGDSSPWLYFRVAT